MHVKFSLEIIPVNRNPLAGHSMTLKGRDTLEGDLWEISTKTKSNGSKPTCYFYHTRHVDFTLCRWAQTPKASEASPRAVQRSIHDAHGEDCTDAAEGDAMPTI